MPERQRIKVSSPPLQQGYQHRLRPDRWTWNGRPLMYDVTIPRTTAADVVYATTNAYADADVRATAEMWERLRTPDLLEGQGAYEPPYRLMEWQAELLRRVLHSGAVQSLTDMGLVSESTEEPDRPEGPGTPE